MTAADGLRRIVAALDRAGIPSMLAGSHASGFHGIPRTTRDIDIVIDTNEAHLRTLVTQLVADDFYADERAALDALRRRSMFNVIDNQNGWKTDLVILPRDDFALTQWDRRERTVVLGVEMFVATAEDTVLAKLVWAKRGGSELQLRDVAGVVGVQGDRLDRAYVDDWARRLGVDEFWRGVVGALPPP